MKISNLLRLCFFITISLLLYSCNKNSEFKSNFGMRTITYFQVLPENNARNIYVGHMGIIDEAKKTITISLPKSADLTSVKPTILLAPFASVSPANLEAVNMSDTTEYIVTAQNGKKAYYTVICKNDYVYPGATLMFATLKNVMSESGTPIQIRFDKTTVSQNVPEDTDMTAIQLELTPDPYSHHATYYVNNKPFDFSEPIDFTQHPNGLRITIISENTRNFSVYTIKLD